MCFRPVSEVFQTRPWPQDLQLLVTVSGHWVTLLCITRRKSYREPFSQFWTRNLENPPQMCTFSSTNSSRRRTHRLNPPLWALGAFSTSRPGEDPGLQYGIIYLWELGRKTDADGRCSSILPPGTTLEAGVYKMIFQTGPYFASTNRETFFPVVEVSIPPFLFCLFYSLNALGSYSFLRQPHYVTLSDEGTDRKRRVRQITFNLKSPEQCYHIPLLLSPYSYTTYRGS